MRLIFFSWLHPSIFDFFGIGLHDFSTFHASDLMTGVTRFKS